MITFLFLLNLLAIALLFGLNFLFLLKLQKEQEENINILLARTHAIKEFLSGLTKVYVSTPDDKIDHLIETCDNSTDIDN